MGAGIEGQRGGERTRGYAREELEGLEEGMQERQGVERRNGRMARKSEMKDVGIGGIWQLESSER